jgi:hypothetical protein
MSLSFRTFEPIVLCAKRITKDILARMQNEEGATSIMLPTRTWHCERIDLVISVRCLYEVLRGFVWKRSSTVYAVNS